MTIPTTQVSAGGHHHQKSCERRTNNTYQKLLDCVTLEGVREHQQAFQEIADANDDPFYPGSRAAGTKGYADSVDYVAGLLEDAGYEVTLDPFEFDFVFPSILQQVTPTPADYLTGTFTGSGSGDVTAAVTPVDINITDPSVITSGCDGAFTEAAVGAPILADPDWCRRLRRLPGRQRRPDPARRLQLRPQGAQRRGRRRLGGDHLQPGQRPDPHRADRR